MLKIVFGVRAGRVPRQFQGVRLRERECTRLLPRILRRLENGG